MPAAELLDWIDAHMAAQDRAIRSVPPAEIAAVIELVKRAVREGRRIFVCGNGGNAANAAHFTTDLGKNASAAAARPFKVLFLADHLLVIEEGHYGRVEDAQMNILHMICYAVCELG